MKVEIPTFNKSNVEFWLQNEHIINPGDEIEFTYALSGNPWRFLLKREDSQTGKYRYSLGGDGGEYGTWRRRYRTLSDAFLHVVNSLNENGNVKNHYASLEEWRG